MPKLFALVFAVLQVGATLAPTGTLRATFIANNRTLALSHRRTSEDL